MNVVILPPLYLPPSQYFRAIADADLAVIDTEMRYDKRHKAVHRTILEGQHGPAMLTVPVTTPGTSRCLWNNVTVSPHGEWYRNHTATLATLLGPTPWFALLNNDFTSIINASAVGRSIVELDIDLILAVMRIAHITTPLTAVPDPRIMASPHTAVTDLRRKDWYREPQQVSVLHTLSTHGHII